MGKERPKGEARTGHFLAAEMELRVASTQREPDGKKFQGGGLPAWLDAGTRGPSLYAAVLPPGFSPRQAQPSLTEEKVHFPH